MAKHLPEMLLEESVSAPDDPLGMAWEYLAQEGFSLHKDGGRILTHVKSSFSEYPVCLEWYEDPGVFSVCLAFDYRFPKRFVGKVRKLVLMANEHLLIGHFEYRPEDDAIYYRSALPLLRELSEAELKVLLDVGIEACDDYAVAFASILAGASAKQALQDARALQVTVGSA